MSSKIADVGGQYLLGVLYGATAKPTAFTIQLFTDSTAPADTHINTTHTKAVGGGYVDGEMTNDATIALDSSGRPIATWPAVSFAFTGPLTGPATITGYQVLQGTTLLFAETLATPYQPEFSGDTLIITPSFVLGNGTPT
jgi:hypothetical protein